jgi:rhodanese-related sulfurtransferase
MNRLRESSVLFLLLFVSVGLLLPFPTQAEKIQTLTAPEVKNMVDNGNVVLINTLSAIEFEIQHIPTSINIPVITMKVTDKLPEDTNTRLIFYCMGIR